ncbi:MAG: HAD family hydrolase [Thermoleophilia bacterium]|jgi:phosphoglycolate phosphatase|nr:HAD family hydrolase [Thermoleophilia bacterium]
MAQRLIMLDFDGVIVDSLEATYAGAVQYLEANGLGHLASPDALLAMLDHNWYEGMARAGLPPGVAEALDGALMEGLRERIDEIEPVPGMPQVIERLSRRHTVVVITSNFGWFVGGVFRRVGVSGVTEVAGADDHKSKVRKMTQARARYPHPGGCCYVGDTVGDIAEAREAGVASVAVTWGWHPEERLRAAGPDAVARDPDELARILTDGGGIFGEAGGNFGEVALRAPERDAEADAPEGDDGVHTT